MANEQNLRPSEYKLSLEEAKKGGINSGKARREKADLRKIAQAVLDGTYTDKNGKTFTGYEAVENGLIKNLTDAKGKNWSKTMDLLIQLTGANKSKAEIELIKAQAEVFKAKAESMSSKEKQGNEYRGIPASLIAPAFAPVVFDIADKAHTEYIFPGGRGSTKSTFVGLQILDILMQNEQLHALVLRQFSNTLKDSVYAQIIWGLAALGLDDEFECTKSPLEITRKLTGQKIYFRGADDPNKIKSIKPEFGYIGVLWFEELDQFHGEEEVRRIEQSAIRGGDTAYIFKTFNPPRSALNWANKYIKIPKDSRIVTMSDYLSVPKKWLGKPFLDEAEFLRDTNPEAYANEYLGEANGSGGNVFENVTIREITDDEISTFDNIMNGVDWGYFPDKYAFERVHYAAAQHTLYIWDEYTSNKESNRQTADKLLEKGITPNDLITCDSAEPKSVGDYRAFGFCARPAEKGPDSRSYSYKWLQSLREIVIDNRRCPVAAQEFLGKEYERDRDGNIVSGYPDGDDHAIDAIRYATERKWRKRGQ